MNGEINWDILIKESQWLVETDTYVPKNSPLRFLGTIKNNVIR
jgi:hypothetical protein